MRIVGCSIGAIGGTAAYALLVGVLVGLSHVSGATKFVGFATAAAWGGIVVAVAALCGFAPGRSGRVPVPTLPFAFFLRKLVRSSNVGALAIPLAAMGESGAAPANVPHAWRNTRGLANCYAAQPGWAH